MGFEHEFSQIFRNVVFVLGYKGLEISFDDLEKGNIPYLTTRIVRHYKQIQC